ncbi:hypothetical protein BsWGS_15947 [Bradybaena similaris]
MTVDCQHGRQDAGRHWIACLTFWYSQVQFHIKMHSKTGPGLPSRPTLNCVPERGPEKVKTAGAILALWSQCCIQDSCPCIVTVPGSNPAQTVGFLSGKHCQAVQKVMATY